MGERDAQAARCHRTRVGLGRKSERAGVAIFPAIAEAKPRGLLTLSSGARSMPLAPI